MANSFGIGFVVGATLAPTVANVFSTVEHKIQSTSRRMEELRTKANILGEANRTYAQLRETQSIYAAGGGTDPLVRKVLENNIKAYQTIRVEAKKYGIEVANYGREHARAMNCKVHDGKLVLFDGPAAESRPSGLTIPKSGSPLSPTRYSFKQVSSGTAYTKAEAAYTDPMLGETYTAEAYATSNAFDEQDGEKALTIDTRVESPAEAESLAQASLHNANAKENPASLELMGHPGLVAGITVNLTGFGDFSGTYFVTKAEHKISGSGGYSTSVEMNKGQG